MKRSINRTSAFTLLLVSISLLGHTDGGGGGSGESERSLRTLETDSSTVMVQGPLLDDEGDDESDDGIEESDDRTEIGDSCWLLNSDALICNGTTNLTDTLALLQPQTALLIRRIEIGLGRIPTLNLNEFHKFSKLEELRVSGSNVSNLKGHIPPQLLSLNLSSNLLKSIEDSVFTFPDSSYNSSQSSSEESAGVSEGALARLQLIDLSHNKITELPKAIFNIDTLKELRLAGNQFKCEFVWEKLWEWYERSDPGILVDADDTFCGVVDDVRVFHYTLQGVLKAHKDLEESCSSVDKSVCRDCSLYALQRDGSLSANISISLKLDCSNRNLTSVPQVPLTTWQLNISNNQISDLSPLKGPMYSNLLILDADNNHIQLESLIGTEFMDKYNYLSLQNNHFSTIPNQILSSFKSMRGQGVTFFGGNFIDCDCDSVKEVKPLLIENSKKIKDMKDIYCKEMTNGDSTSYMRVKDLQYPDVCYMESENSSHEVYLYLVIVAEVALIVLIIGKVWHDRRTFRQTGILPWCSAKMPRLPCDAMLESVKEPPNGNNRHVAGSAASSSTNVNAHSISHIQLKDVRSSSSAHSEKSSSQQSQFSSFPVSSSRTSPV